MQEDVAGTQAAGTGHSYSTCSQCGQVFLRKSVRAETAGLQDGSHSEFTELCPACEALERQGERPVAVDDEDT